MHSFTVSAKWLFDGERLLEGATISVRGDSIVSIEPLRNADIHLPDSIIIPGLVNAHTHLELGFLRGKLAPTDDFLAWLDRVKRLRERADSATVTAAVREGITEALHFGTTMLVDHTALKVWSEEAEHHLRIVVAHELLNNTPPLVTGEGPLTKPALAPHSPYRLPQTSLKAAAEMAKQNRLLLSIHTAEHPAEIEFLLTGGGPMRQLLLSFGVDLNSFCPPRMRPLEYLHSLGLLTPKTLLVHANYLTDTEIGLIRESGSAVVYCPRSHAFFSHPPHPFPKLLEAGIPVFFGTDSLASCPDLNLLSDIALARDLFGVAPETLLRFATAAPAAFIWQEKLGRLQEGTYADFAAFPLPKTKHPLEALLQERPPAKLLCCNGKLLLKKC